MSVIAQKIAQLEDLARTFASDGATYPTCARASAVASLLLAKLRRDTPDADELPLEILVTPASLPVWRSIFATPARADAAGLLRYFQPLVPRVRPQPDGSLVVSLIWLHPEMKSLLVSEPRMMTTVPITLRLVENPDDWRVERIG